MLRFPFPTPSVFEPAADVVIGAVALIARLHRNDMRLTRRWHSPSSPGTRAEAWVRRVEQIQQLRCSIERRMDLTELASRGIDDGLPSRQQARLRGMRDAAEQAANTLRRILRDPDLEGRQQLEELIDQLEDAAFLLDELAFDLCPLFS